MNALQIGRGEARVISFDSASHRRYRDIHAQSITLSSTKIVQRHNPSMFNIVAVHVEKLESDEDVSHTPKFQRHRRPSVMTYNCSRASVPVQNMTAIFTIRCKSAQRWLEFARHTGTIRGFRRRRNSARIYADSRTTPDHKALGPWWCDLSTFNGGAITYTTSVLRESYVCCAMAKIFGDVDRATHHIFEFPDSPMNPQTLLSIAMACNAGEFPMGRLAHRSD